MIIEKQRIRVKINLYTIECIVYCIITKCDWHNCYNIRNWATNIFVSIGLECKFLNKIVFFYLSNQSPNPCIRMTITDCKEKILRLLSVQTSLTFRISLKKPSRCPICFQMKRKLVSIRIYCVNKKIYFLALRTYNLLIPSNDTKNSVFLGKQAVVYDKNCNWKSDFGTGMPYPIFKV